MNKIYYMGKEYVGDVSSIIDTDTILTDDDIPTMRRKDFAGGYTITATSLTTSNKIISITDDFVIDGFTRTSDGGYKCSKDGWVRISGCAYFSNVNSTDNVALTSGVYANGAWKWENASAYASGTTVKTAFVLETLRPVQTGDNIYLRARNVSAARGECTIARLFVEYI